MARGRAGWPAAACILLIAASGLACAAPSGGDASRGAAVAASRSQGLCVLCHALPGVPAHLSGDIGPPLAGIGARRTPQELRERLLWPERFNPDTLMPGYGGRAALERVGAAWAGKPLLTPQQVEDVLAWLETLR